MKMHIIIKVIVITFYLNARSEDRFVLRLNTTSELWGPYLMKNGEEIGDGNFKVMNVSEDTFNIEGYVRGVYRKFGPFSKTEYSKVIIGDSEYSLIIGRGLEILSDKVSRDNARRENDKEKREILKIHSEALNKAIESAKKSRFYNDAIETLEQALDQWPEASEIPEAKRLLEKYRREQKHHLEQEAKGLVLQNGKWIRPPDPRDADALLAYYDSTYRRIGGVYSTEMDALDRSSEILRKEQRALERGERMNYFSPNIVYDKITNKYVVVLTIK